LSLLRPETLRIFFKNPHKASGPDQIPTRLLKLCASDLAPAIARVFQTSLNSGTVPSDWKEALITPLFKHYEGTHLYLRVVIYQLVLVSFKTRNA
jgi:hypothetical protein